MQHPAAKKAAAGKKVAAKTCPAAKSATAADASKPKTEAELPANQALRAGKVATAKPASNAAAAFRSANSASGNKIKGVAPVAARLKKTESKPARQTGLLAMFKALLATTSPDPAIQSVLSQLIAGGKLSIDEQGAVRYSPQPYNCRLAT